MFNRSILAWAFATFVGFAVFCTAMHVPQIEYDLAMRAEAAFASEGFTDIEVDFDGRDGLLTGQASDQASIMQAAAVVADMNGVHSVDNQVELEEQGRGAGVTALQADIDELLRERRIEFESGSARLTTGGRVVVDQAARLLRTDQSATAVVGGHTDGSGPAEGNLTLSRERAEAVTQRLVKQGIDAGRLSAAGFGASRPVADNRTLEGREKNRRIEITLQSVE